MNISNIIPYGGLKTILLINLSNHPSMSSSLTVGLKPERISAAVAVNKRVIIPYGGLKTSYLDAALVNPDSDVSSSLTVGLKLSAAKKLLREILSSSSSLTVGLKPGCEKLGCSV